MHTIWLSNTTSPTVPPESSYEYLFRTISCCESEGNWEYIFWINNVSQSIKENIMLKLRAISHAKNINFLIVDPIEAFTKELGWLKNVYSHFVEDGRVGAAADIARYVILWSQGGIYRDIDFEFIKNPIKFHYLVDFYGGLEGLESATICNAMIAAKPHHPILKRALELIQHNLLYQPPYMLSAGSIHQPLWTLCCTGPFLFSIACENVLRCDASTSEELNLIFPSPTFFWHDQITLEKQSELLNTIRLGRHYHSKSWCNLILGK